VFSAEITEFEGGFVNGLLQLDMAVIFIIATAVLLASKSRNLPEPHSEIAFDVQQEE